MSKKIKVGYDAKRVFQNFTGLGNFSRTLLSSLSIHQPALDLHLYAPKKVLQPRTANFAQAPFKTHFANTIFQSYWRSKGIVKDLEKDDIQIYHGLSHEIPLGLEKTNIKSIVSIHDLIIKADPKQFKKIDRWIYDQKFKSSCERADLIVAISESTRRDIIEHYQIDEKKIKVIYQTCHDQFKEVISAEKLKSVKEKYNLPNEYLLTVGSAIPRKNLLGLVQALEKLSAKPRPPLLVVSGKSKYRNQVQAYIEKKKLGKSFRFLDEIEFEDLPALYHLATATCYPSIYEGFGLPVIESLFCGTPVITTSASSLPEAGGSGALYAEPSNVASLATKIEEILGDKKLQTTLAKDGLEHLQQFNTAAICREWAKIYAELIG